MSLVAPLVRVTMANAFFSYSTNYLIDTDHSVIVDVEGTRSIRQAEVGSVRTMLDRIEGRHDIDPERLIADTACGTGPMLGWLVKRGIAQIVRTLRCNPSAPIQTNRCSHRPCRATHQAMATVAARALWGTLLVAGMAKIGWEMIHPPLFVGGLEWPPHVMSHLIGYIIGLAGGMITLFGRNTEQHDLSRAQCSASRST